jgi:hypothetical protein
MSITILGVACKSVKPEQSDNSIIVEEIEMSDLDTIQKEFINSSQKNSSIINWEYLTARYDAEITDGMEFNQTISLNVRMKKNSIIWFTVSMAFFKLATGVITKDSIHILDHINSRYYPLSTVNNIGIPLPNLFQNIQDLLFIGNPISNKIKWDGNTYNDSFSYQNKNDSLNSNIYYSAYSNNLFIDSQLFKFETSAKNKQNKLPSILLFKYPERDGNNVDFPIPSVSITELIQNDQLMGRLKFELRTARFNKITSYPFSIPAGYEKSSL